MSFKMHVSHTNSSPTTGARPTVWELLLYSQQSRVSLTRTLCEHCTAVIDCNICTEVHELHRRANTSYHDSASVYT
jgi:hypothetical protein